MKFFILSLGVYYLSAEFTVLGIDSATFKQSRNILGWRTMLEVFFEVLKKPVSGPSPLQ